MRLERTTHSLEGCCSIQLSYGTVVFSFCGGKYRSSFDFVPPRERPLAGQPHQNDAFPSLLFITKREFCVRIKPAESFDSQNVFGNACNGVANAKKFFAGLATVLQTPESFPRDLQQCCKRQKVFRETCNGVANAEKFFAGLATVLQTLSIPELPKLTADNQFLPLGRLYAAHDTGVDAERAAEGDDFFCPCGV